MDMRPDPTTCQGSLHQVDENGIHADHVDNQQPGWFASAHIDEIIESGQDQKAPPGTYIYKGTCADALDDWNTERFIAKAPIEEVTDKQSDDAGNE